MQFGFRDAGHYYYPLHLRVQQEWRAGRWPLWAPEWNAGMPLLGNPTAAVLYPGKVIFFLLPDPWAARAYVVGHVLLAFAAMWALLRGWRISAVGATLGALGYAFGAPVLSLSCNVIYLVGAGWAPLGFLAADRWLRMRRRGALAGLTLVLTMQFLGGDPQSAYLTIVCALAYAAGLAAARVPSAARRISSSVAAGLFVAYLALLAFDWRSARSAVDAAGANEAGETPWLPPRGAMVAAAWGIAATVVYLRSRRGRGDRGLGPMAGGLARATAVALAIAGAQLVPVAEFARLSVRATEGQGLYDIYRFGVHPLQVLDAVWPNVFGTTDQGNRSWVVALPGTRDPQLWIPSLYLGGLILVLATAAAGFRGGPPWRAWLTCVAVVSFLAALGVYASPLFWARCVPTWVPTLGPPESPTVPRFRADGYLRDGDGGVYWFLASGLPAFRTFRFPGKFLVFTALAVCGLAGAGWDRLVEGRSRRAGLVAGGLLALTLGALAATWLGGGALRAWLGEVAGVLRSINGPLDVEGAIADLRAALAHGGLTLAAALIIVISAPRRPALAGAFAVVALSIDLGLANARHAATVPQSTFEGTPRILKAIREAEKADPSPGPFRVERLGSWTPPQWLAQRSPRRAEEVVRWERDTLRSNYELPLGVSSTFSLGATELFDHGSFFYPFLVRPERARASDLGLRPGQAIWYYPRRAFDLWSTRYFIVAGSPAWGNPDRGYASLIPHTTQVYPAAGAFDGPNGPERRTRWMISDDVKVLRNDAAYPRARVVHDARTFPPIRRLRPSDRRELMREILYQGDLWHEPTFKALDPRRLAWVETDRPDDILRSLSRAEPDPSEVVTFTVDDPRHVAMTAVLRSPGLVVLADVYYPGWTLTVDGRPAEILRTNRAMRGATLPEGTHHLDFRFEPISFRIGMAVSTIGFIALAAMGVWAVKNKEPCPK